MKRLAILIAAAVGLAGRAADAQMPHTAVSIGTSERFYSSVLEEERTILIATPRTFDATFRYPVLILMDGDSHFAHATAAAAFLSDVGRIPPLIVVGIPNNARLRDLSPPTDVPEDVADGSGGDAFLDFLVKELSPWLEANYRAAPLRILFGHSRGGLINMHALLTRPDAFRAHIAASPYFGWSKDRMIVRAGTEIAQVSGKHFLYLTAGEGEPEIRDSVVRMAEVLKRKAPAGLDWRFEPISGDDHGSTPYVTLYRGLQSFFAQWTPNASIAAGDVAAFDAHYEALSREFKFPVIPGAIAFDGLGEALLEKGRAEAAVQVLRRSVQAYPRNRYLFASLSRALSAAGRRKEAREALQHAYEIGRASMEPEDRAELEAELRRLQ